MEFLNKLETTIGGWTKNVPHLPIAGQKWLAQNVWWIALIGAILSGIGVILSLVAVLGYVAVVGTASSLYYVSSAVVTMSIITGIVGLVFLVAEGIILATAVKPLKAMQKKGWVLLFLLWLLGALSVVINSVLTFSIGGFLIGIIFGAIWLAISGYFLYEIHGQFAHTTKAAAKK